MIKYLKDWQQENPVGFGAFWGFVFSAVIFLFVATMNGCFG